MKFLEALSLLFIAYEIFGKDQDDLISLQKRPNHLNTTILQFPQRLLVMSSCVQGTLDSNNQCQCNGGYFGETCETSATRLTLNDYSYASLSQEKHYFYIDLTNENKELKMVFELLPKSVHIDLAFTDRGSYLLPRTSIFASYDSPDGKKLWETSLSFENFDLSLKNRLFIFVTRDQSQNSDKDFKIKISEETSSTLTIILIVVGTISIILNIVGCIYFVKYKIRREVQAALRLQSERDNLFQSIARHNAADRARNRIHIDEDAALTQEDLNLYFPEKTFTEFQSSFAQTDCPICLEEFKSDITCRQLYCVHIFHTKCIEYWLAKQKACPTCKKSMSRKAIGDHFLTLKKEEKGIPLSSNEDNIQEPTEQLPEHRVEIPVGDIEEAHKINQPEEEVNQE